MAARGVLLVEEGGLHLDLLDGLGDGVETAAAEAVQRLAALGARVSLFGVTGDDVQASDPRIGTGAVHGELEPCGLALARDPHDLALDAATFHPAGGAT